MDLDGWPDWLKYVVTAGLVLLILGVVLWRLAPLLFFKRRAAQTNGTITNWMTMKQKGIAYYYPLISFTDAHGTEHRYRADERSENRPTYAIGTQVKVFYNAKNPKQVKTEYPDQNA